jgi:hypothetical protein
MAVATAAVVAFALAARAEPDAPQDGKLGARIGGKCTYVEHPGTCTVVSIEKTQDSIAQASIDGGPGYEDLTVTFTYAGSAAGDERLVRQALEGTHELHLMNSGIPDRASSSATASPPANRLPARSTSSRRARARPRPSIFKASTAPIISKASTRRGP